MKIELGTKRLIIWWYREDGMIFPLTKLSKPVGLSLKPFESFINNLQIENKCLN